MIIHIPTAFLRFILNLINNTLKNMKLQQCSLWLIFAFMSMVAVGQSTFFKIYPAADNSIGVKSIETISHGFFIVGNNGYYSSIPRGIIMKINSNGDLIEKLILPEDATPSGLSTINNFAGTEIHYLLTGYKDTVISDVVYTVIKMYVINESLNFISEHLFWAGKELSIYPWQLKTGGNNFFFLLCNVDSTNQPTSPRQFCVLKFNNELDSVSAYFSQGSSYHLIGDLLYDEKQKKVDIFYFGPYITKSGSSMKVLELDSNLNYIASLSLPENIITEPYTSPHS